MAFIINYDQAQEGGYLAPEGDYEVLISQARFDQTAGSKEYIRLSLSIREDIAQEGAGQRLDYRVWKWRESVDRDPQGYPQHILQRLARCAGLPNGQEYPDIAGLLEALCGRAIKVSVRHEEYNEVVRAKVNYIMPSDEPRPLGGFVAVDCEELLF